MAPLLGDLPNDGGHHVAHFRRPASLSMGAFVSIAVAVALALEMSDCATGLHGIRVEPVSALQAPVSAFQQAHIWRA